MRVSDSGAIRSRLVPQVDHRLFPRRIVVQKDREKAADLFLSGHQMAITFSSPTNRDARARGAGVTAILGPTNTGKTYLAIERMLAHSSGVIGLPLRLLAREVYNKCVDRVG